MTYCPAPACRADLALTWRSDTVRVAARHAQTPAAAAATSCAPCSCSTSRRSPRTARKCRRPSRRSRPRGWGRPGRTARSIRCRRGHCQLVGRGRGGNGPATSWLPRAEGYVSCSFISCKCHFDFSALYVMCVHIYIFLYIFIYLYIHLFVYFVVSTSMST